MKRWWCCALLVYASASTAAPRVVTLAPHLAELVCAVDACDALVGVVRYTDAPPQAAALPQVGDAFSVNLEEVIRLRADLVLAWDGGTSDAVVARLRSMGLRVETIAIRDLDGVGAGLRTVGTLMGVEAAGRHAAEAFESRLTQLRERFGDRPRLRAFYQIETDPAFSINRRSPIHEALALCGAENVFADLPTLAGAVGPEAVIAAKPEVLVYSRQESAADIAAYWKRLPAFLPPVQASHRVVVDGNTLTRQSPRVLEGVEELCDGLDRVRELNAAK